jgi:hypothetical protein
VNRSKSKLKTAAHTNTGSGARLKRLPADVTSFGWRFTELHIEVYEAIQCDPEARRAFEILTSGPAMVLPAHLLLNLGEEKKHYLGIQETDDGKWIRSGTFDDSHWKNWNSKWKGIAANAKSMRRISLKLTDNIRKSDRGPIALPTLREGDVERAASHGADNRLQSISEELLGLATEIEQYCETRRQWIKKMPKKDRRDIIEKERLVLLVRWIESRTGRPHFPQIAALLNATRGTVGATNHVDPDYLRKLSSRLSKLPIIQQIYPSQRVRKITIKK